MKRYCDIREVSEYTGLPVKTLYDWAAQGIVPSIKIRRRVLFDLTDIDDLLENMKRPRINTEDRARKIIG